MATGYTYYIGEEDNQPFDEFVWKCAKAFNRHVSESVEVTKPTEYFFYRDLVIDQEKELKLLQSLSLDEAMIVRDQEYYAEAQSLKQRQDDKIAKLRRYNEMLSKVNDWIPPSKDHENLKKFMVDQLTSSISQEDYDVGSLGDKKPVNEWLKEKIDYLVDDIKRSKERAKKDHEDFLKRVEWIDILANSVPIKKGK